MLLSKKTKEFKICKIENLEFAKWCLENEINYLGVHILESENVGKFKELCDYISSLNKNKLVIVTKITDLDLLSRLIFEYNPMTIQFHYKVTEQFLQEVTLKFPSLKVFGCIVKLDDLNYINLLNKYCERIIFDSSYNGGTGQKHNNNELKNIPEILLSKILLAGGVDYDMIQSTRDLDLVGYDIQSFFRNKETRENYFNQVIEISSSQSVNKISLSVTDLSYPISEEILNYQKHLIYDYHLDYSDGTLYPDFLTNLEITRNKLRQLNQKPVSIHLFSSQSY